MPKDILQFVRAQVDDESAEDGHSARSERKQHDQIDLLFEHGVPLGKTSGTILSASSENIYLLLVLLRQRRDVVAVELERLVVHVAAAGEVAHGGLEFGRSGLQ